MASSEADGAKGFMEMITLVDHDGKMYQVTLDRFTAKRLVDGDAELAELILKNFKETVKEPELDTPGHDGDPTTSTSKLAEIEKEPTTDVLWTHAATKELIHLRETYMEDFNSNKKVNKRVWEQIAQDLAPILKVTGAQTESKWKNLVRKYKCVIDHNNKSGNKRKTWEHFEDMDAIFKDSPNIMPKYTSSSMSSKSQAPHAPDARFNEPSTSAATGTSAPDLPYDQVKIKESPHKNRKRKYQSKNDVVVSLFKEMKEESAAAEQMRLKLAKEMHDDKMKMLSSLIDVLKGSK